MRCRFRVRFRELNKGHNGGEGRVESYKCFAKDGKSAARKIQKRGRVISVRKISNNSR